MNSLRAAGILGRVKSPEPTALPLAYAAEVALDLCLLRDECCNAARAIVALQPLDEAALEECARLDEALAVAHRSLQAALKRIRVARDQRARKD